MISDSVPTPLRSVHLIGIGGSGMRALAQMLLDRGVEVSGSDRGESESLHRLADHGAKVHFGQQASNLPDSCDVVVYSAAIGPDNPELQAAKKLGCEIIKYSQMLGRLMSERKGIAISGTHGKSTTTAMVAYVLKAAGIDPSYIVGAQVPQLGGPSGVGSGEHFIAEACEYDRSFLNLRPKLAAILNIEEDHLDYYKNVGEILEAFRTFAAQLPDDGLLVVNGEDRNAVAVSHSATCKVETYGLEGEYTWSASDISTTRGRISMDVRYEGAFFLRLDVPLPGRHNASNCLAAIALMHHAGLKAFKISRFLETFAGAHRRMTLKGYERGIMVLDDYAHHPTEIQVTLRAICDTYSPRRLICVFQPHQHSRTRFLLGDFARSFGHATQVIVPDIYFVRDSELEKDCISSEDLVSQIRLCGGEAIYLKSFEDICRHLQKTLEEGDLLVTMGAGNIWEVADETVHWLGCDR